MNSEYRLSGEYNSEWPQGMQDMRAGAAALPLYEAPSVLSYSDREILDQLGPAQTVNYGSTQDLVGRMGGG